jgi:hypothetical protein
MLTILCTEIINKEMGIDFLYIKKDHRSRSLLLPWKPFIQDKTSMLVTEMADKR